MENRIFRRPARLGDEQADQIVGAADPADNMELAHTSAWALLGVPNADFNAETTRRLVETVRTQGVDVVAALWDQAPAFTLPGALWRLYLVWQWNQLDPDTLRARFEEGAHQIADDTDLPDWQLDVILDQIDRALAGRVSEDDLEPLLTATAQALRLMAVGVAGPEWISSDRDDLAHPVTRRPRALLDTADELAEGAAQALRGTLD